MKKYKLIIGAILALAVMPVNGIERKEGAWCDNGDYKCDVGYYCPYQVNRATCIPHKNVENECTYSHGRNAPNDECGPENYCDATLEDGTPATNTCVKKLSVGGICSDDEQCQSDSCDNKTGTCIPKKELNELVDTFKCNSPRTKGYTGCKSGYCRCSFRTGTCMCVNRGITYKKLGENCSRKDPCISGLICDTFTFDGTPKTNTCIEKFTVNAICNANFQCADRNACVNQMCVDGSSGSACAERIHCMARHTCTNGFCR